MAKALLVSATVPDDVTAEEAQALLAAVFTDLVVTHVDGTEAPAGVTWEILD